MILELKGVYVSGLTIKEKQTYNTISTLIEKCIVFVEKDAELKNEETSLSITIIRKADSLTDAVPTTDDGIKVYGYIVDETSELVLFVNYGNAKIEANNVEITYPSYNTDNDTADYVNKCTFGILYTDQYAQNRLVIAGNPDLPNCDWWTDDINVYAHADDVRVRQDLLYNDLTYFPDENFCYYGNDNSAITGYDVDENGKLIVFKEKNEEDPTIYFREGVQVYNGNSSENISQYEYKLNMFSGNAGVYPINNKCILNFNGRTVFLSNEKNLSILVSTDSIKDKGKYSVSGSRFIDKKLEEYSLAELKEKAILFADDKFLYLAIGTTIYACRYDELDSSTLQYDWYVYDTNIFKEDEYITTFVKNEEILYVATNKGNIFELKNEVEDIYEDNYKIWLESGDFTENVLNTNVAKDVVAGDLLKTNYYIRFNDLSNGGKISVESSQYIKTSDESVSKLLTYLADTNRTAYLIDKTNPTEAISINLTYDTDNNRFALESASFSDTKAIAIKQTDGDDLSINSVAENGSYTIEYKFEENNVFTNISLINLEATYTGYIEHIENVSAVYVSAPIHMGTLSYYKNIYCYTLTNDTRKKSELNVSIISNSIPLEQAKEVGGIGDNFGFSLAMFDFNSVALAQDYVAARSYTKYRNIMRQRFTDFVFSNKDNTNAVLSNMSFIYTITNPVVGGD